VQAENGYYVRVLHVYCGRANYDHGFHEKYGLRVFDVHVPHDLCVYHDAHYAHVCRCGHVFHDHHVSRDALRVRVYYGVLRGGRHDDRLLRDERKPNHGVHGSRDVNHDACGDHVSRDALRVRGGRHDDRLLRDGHRVHDRHGGHRVHVPRARGLREQWKSQASLVSNDASLLHACQLQSHKLGSQLSPTQSKQ